MKQITIEKARKGIDVRKLIIVEDNWTSYPICFSTPEKDKLFNFNVFGDTNCLVLDPYGNSDLNDEFTFRLLQYKNTNHYTIAIGIDTGFLYKVHFSKIRGDICVIFSSFYYEGKNIKIPNSYIKRLDELKDKKRPFSIKIDSKSLLQFIDHEIGYTELINDLIFSFHFNDCRLEICADQFQETCWRYIDFPARFK